MASDSAAKTVNGNHASQASYGSGEQQMSSHGFESTTGARHSNTPGAQAPTIPTSSSSAAAESSSSVPKDEVGWYFVEQYYTTLSKSPERLHLFYNKRSQFVSGVEAEKAINDRIKELDIQDCKVRVSNVDSQESFKNIVVQVIGEMSNKAAPHRKFVQTFVLAEQPNGYFVLNDIFRYIEEEEAEEEENKDFEPEEPHPTQLAGAEEPSSVLPEADKTTEQQPDIDEVDHKLEAEVEAGRAASEEPATTLPTSNGEVAEAEAEAQAEAEADVDAEDEAATAVNVSNEQSNVPSEKAEKASEEVIAEPEKPKDPDPTPIASPPKPLQAAPAQAPPPSAPKPAAPKTWANLVAANRAPAPAIPSPASSASPAPSQPKNPPSAATQSTNASAAVMDDPLSRSQPNGNAGWQTAGTDSNRRQTRGQSISGNTDRETVHGYVKNVTDKVDASILKNTLNQHGRLAYFDVSRQKNCAFVEFETAEGYNAAVAANPYSIGGEQVYVEERRPRPAGYGGFNPRGGMRGGRGGADGRPNSQGRGNFPKDGGRGGFVPRGRGGNITPRGGRGQAQPA
ncbi:MAG: hypothetical protein LQ337_004335 [Flavoplaca oasis]|nr:MAG: hypothetical protein LQ337_004335 [Flavoplaca oasis]